MLLIFQQRLGKFFVKGVKIRVVLTGKDFLSTNCGDKLCLQCGEEAHIGKSCLENLQLKLKRQGDPDESAAATVQWKLNHT